MSSTLISGVFEDLGDNEGLLTGVSNLGDARTGVAALGEGGGTGVRALGDAGIGVAALGDVGGAGIGAGRTPP